MFTDSLLSQALLTLFAAECVFLVAWGLRRPGRICEFPFLAGVSFGGFILPQAAGVTFWGAVEGRALNQALFMSVLCSGMCYLGYIVTDQPFGGLKWKMEEGRLLVASTVLSAVGAAFFYLINQLPTELTEVSRWTGLPVAYMFLAQMLRYGFAIALLLYAKNRSRAAVVLMLFASLFFFEWIVIRARRGMAIELVLFFVCAFWFARRRTLPWWATVPVLGAGILGLFSAGAYRSAMYQDQVYGSPLRHEIPWDEVMQIDFVDTFTNSVQKECYEFRNAAYHMRVRAESRNYDYGLSYWNELVFAYVPAQIVGEDAKQALMFELVDEVSQFADFELPGGTTITGISDSFEAFGYFGCLVFFGIAYVARRLYETAQAGHMAAQLLYMVIITNAMLAITHHTKWFVTPWIHFSVFFLPWLLWAGQRPAPSHVLGENRP